MAGEIPAGDQHPPQDGPAIGAGEAAGTVQDGTGAGLDDAGAAVSEPAPEEAGAEEPSEPEPEALELAELRERLAAIESGVGDFHRRSAHRETVIDRLHAENQTLRDGLHRSLVEPLVTDLIRLYDSLAGDAARLAESAAKAAADGSADPGDAGERDGRVAKLIASYADDVLLILERYGFEAFTAQRGDAFDAMRHMASAVVPTTDAALDKTVAEPLTAGFVECATGRVRRPARARFHRHRPEPPPGDEGPGGTG